MPTKPHTFFDRSDSSGSQSSSATALVGGASSGADAPPTLAGAARINSVRSSSLISGVAWTACPESARTRSERISAAVW